jgi:single-strand DNA-binding protein
MSVAEIGLACNRKFKGKDGEMREETTFVDCEAWGRTAETMAKYLSKGRPVFVEGRLKLDQWQDKDGSNRSKLRVVIESFQFIDSRGGQSSTPPQETAATAPPSDDVPF